MRFTKILALTLLLCPAVAGQAPGKPGERVVARLDWEAEPFAWSAQSSVALGERPPANVALPAGIGEPRFGEVRLGSGTIAVALDANPGNPRLWVD
ncbi:MAG: hypothetical protein KAI24_16830, partial [Planctomycetes bacterium]|nr:hypothetical protein [Planctomycetota bacterium]